MNDMIAGLIKTQTFGSIYTHQHSVMTEIGDPVSFLDDLCTKHTCTEIVQKTKLQLTRIFKDIPGEYSGHLDIVTDTERSGHERLILTWHIALLKMEKLIGFFDWFSSYILNYIRIQ